MASWTKDGSGNWVKSKSTKKNYTIVDGKKVEKVEETRSSPATSSDTWNKDKITLEEAKQQTSDVESGVININKGTTSIEPPSTTETISLEQARQQTETESANRVTAAESAQASQTPTAVSKQVTTITNVDKNGDYTVTEETVTESKYNNLATIKAGSSIKSAAQLDPVTKTETESKVVKKGSLKSLYSVADPINYSELKVPESITTTNKVHLSDAAINTFKDQKISAAELSSSSTTTKPFALEDKYNNPHVINTENIINTTANAYDSVTAAVGKNVVTPAAKIADKVIEYADTNLESTDQKDYSKYEATSLYGESEYVLKETPTQTIANATANAAQKSAGYYVSAVSEVKEAAKNTLDAGNVFQVMDEGSGPNYQVNEKKASETAAAKFVFAAGETVALAPVAIPQAATAFIKNPVSATKDFVVNTGESIVADPATGLGTVAGMLITGSVIKGTVKVGKGAAGKVREFATDVKNSRVYEKQTATLNEFRTVPESIKSMPDVEPVASRLGLVDVGIIKTADAFELRNSSNKSIQNKSSLDRNAFNIKNQLNRNQNIIAKVETPESAVNYAENMAKLSELKSNSYRRDYTGDFFDRVENPNQVRAMDTKASAREWALDKRASKVKTFSPEVLKNFDKFDNQIGADTKTSSREWALDKTVKSSKPRLQSPAKYLTSDLANTVLQNEYFKKKNLAAMLEDERGTVALDTLGGITSGRGRMAVVDRVIEQSKPVNKPTIGDLQRQRDYLTKEFRNPVEEAVQRPKRSELIASIEGQMSSKGKIPSLEEQFRARSVQSSIARSKAFVVPSFAVAQNDLTAQMNDQLPAQANIQQQVPIHQLDHIQSLKQTTRLDSKYKAQNMLSEVQNRNKAKGKKQTQPETNYITSPVGLNDIVKPSRISKSTEPPIIPSFVPVGKKRSSKKGKKSNSGWNYDRLYNNYGDASKWRGF